MQTIEIEEIGFYKIIEVFLIKRRTLHTQN
jgi:hypothetical protein